MYGTASFLWRGNSEVNLDFFKGITWNNHMCTGINANPRGSRFRQTAKGCNFITTRKVVTPIVDGYTYLQLPIGRVDNPYLLWYGIAFVPIKEQFPRRYRHTRLRINK